MPKRSHTAARVAHTKQKPKPRYVSKAHLQERDENAADLAAKAKPPKK